MTRVGGARALPASAGRGRVLCGVTRSLGSRSLSRTCCPTPGRVSPESAETRGGSPPGTRRNEWGRRAVRAVRNPREAAARPGAGSESRGHSERDEPRGDERGWSAVPGAGRRDLGAPKLSAGRDVGSGRSLPPSLPLRLSFIWSLNFFTLQIRRESRVPHPEGGGSRVKPYL